MFKFHHLYLSQIITTSYLWDSCFGVYKLPSEVQCVSGWSPVKKALRRESRCFPKRINLNPLLSWFSWEFRKIVLKSTKNSICHWSTRANRADCCRGLCSSWKNTSWKNTFWKNTFWKNTSWKNASWTNTSWKYISGKIKSHGIRVSMGLITLRDTISTEFEQNWNWRIYQIRAGVLSDRR